MIGRGGGRSSSDRRRPQECLAGAALSGCQAEERPRGDWLDYHRERGGARAEELAARRIIVWLQ